MITAVRLNTLITMVKPLALRQFTKGGHRVIVLLWLGDKATIKIMKVEDLKMCMKYMINREDLGKRVTGYMFYDADSKGFTGMTEKAIKDTLNKGERLYGLVLDSEGNIAMDTEGFKTSNYMVRSGINNLAPAFDSDCPANMMYVVVGMRKVQGGENVYEVISSRYARVEMPESKIKMLLEFGCIQGGVYLDGKGKLVTCEGVRVDDGKGVG